MKKLRAIIEKAYDFGKLPKGITPYMMGRLVDIYNALARKEEVEFIESGINDLLAGRETGFIQKEINDLLGKCGIKTREFGIGWETVIV